MYCCPANTNFWLRKVFRVSAHIYLWILWMVSKYVDTHAHRFPVYIVSFNIKLFHLVFMPGFIITAAFRI